MPWHLLYTARRGIHNGRPGAGACVNLVEVEASGGVAGLVGGEGEAAGLSAATLARELNVSVRTLQRAFTAVGETVISHVRKRRLEEARLALAAPADRVRLRECRKATALSPGSFLRTG